MLIAIEPLLSQENGKHEELSENAQAGTIHKSTLHHEFPRHKIAVFTGNTWVRKGNFEGNPDAVLVPTFGLDYEYWIHHRVAIGLFNDYELGQYIVEKENGESIIRENVFISTMVLIGEPVKGWALFAGGGIELEKNEHFWVIRIGTEYAWALPKNWTIAITASWDIKNEYDAIAGGIALGKHFGKVR